jgi:hypothetical protein
VVFYGAVAPSAAEQEAVHRDSSLNLFEADLADFEIFTGPLHPFCLHNGDAATL